MTDIFLAIAVILLFACGYVITNLYKKIETYEAWIKAYQNSIGMILENMRQIDANGAFESDDEVGQIFRMLKSQVLVLEQFSTAGVKSSEEKGKQKG